MTYLKVNKSSLKVFLAGVIFACLTLLTTYPLSCNLGESTYGYPGDGFTSIWQLWRFQSDLPWNRSDLIGAPLCVLFSDVLPTGLYYLGIVLAMISNEVVAYNLLMMLGFWLSAFSVYMLTRFLWEHEWAAILAGIVYGFSSYITWRGQSHLGLVHAEFMAFYLLALFYLNQKKSWFSALLCGIALAAGVISNFYYGYFMVVMTVVFLVSRAIYLVRHRELHPDWKLINLYGLTFLIAVCLSLPWTWSVAQAVFVEPSADTQLYRMVQRPYSDFFNGSARPWDYLLPPIDHPVFGKFSREVRYSIQNLDLQVSGDGIPGLQYNWLTNRSLFLHQYMHYMGYTALALAVLGLGKVFFQRGKTLNDREKFAVFSLVMIFAVAIWFSMPPFVPVGELLQNLSPHFPDWKLVTPSYYTRSLLPMFRINARFGTVATLALAVLAGFGLRELLLAISTRKAKVSVIISIFALVIFELLHHPHNTSFSRVPEEYEWLARQQPDDLIVAEYPLGWDSYALFYQRVHQKRMLNDNGMQFIIARMIWPNIFDLSDPVTIERLGAMDVQIVLVRTAYLGQKIGGSDIWPTSYFTTPVTQTVPGLHLVKTTASAQIFEVSDSSASMMIWPNPCDSVEKLWLSSMVWKGENAPQRLYLLNASDKTVTVTLSTTLAQGEGWFRDATNSPMFQSMHQAGDQLLLPGIVLPSGETIVEIYFSPDLAGTEIIWSAKVRHLTPGG